MTTAKHGGPVVVVISVEEYERLKAREKSASAPTEKSNGRKRR
ncbi:MAG: type II toxin-antitoxin system prevent-host-death family antitoxin [Alphaproteobacteria bacterium]